MSAPSLTRDGDIFLLDLGDGEGRFNPDTCAALAAAIAEVETAPAPRALVTTASGKIWSNGLDLEWLGQNGERLQETLNAVHRVYAAILGAGIPTVAAVQGHAFAGGAMLAIAHDHVVMREDRGFWCVPEIDLGMPFTPAMSALLTARLPRRAAHTAMTTGRRYGGPDAVAAGIVDAAVPEADVLPSAIAWATSQAGKNPDILRAIKRGIHGPALDSLTADIPL